MSQCNPIIERKYCKHCHKEIIALSDPQCTWIHALSYDTHCVPVMAVPEDKAEPAD